MRLTEALLHALKRAGAREIFGIPGDFALPYFRIVEESRILPLYTLSHEPGVGFAGTPASRSLTGAVPVKRAGMASATADLQRDLGGAIMQSILGAFLTAGYAASFSKLISSSPQADQVSENVQTELTKSFSSAAQTAGQYPKYSDQIIEAAKQSFLKGDDLAFLAGAIAILLGAVVIRAFFPGQKEENELLASYARQDSPGPESDPV